LEELVLPDDVEETVVGLLPAVKLWENGFFRM
jgi:hypothetical protein